VIKSFTFEHSDKTFTCTVEERKTAPVGTWWWFTVSNDTMRYAPFEAVPSDTQASVLARIVAYYDRRLWARAQPVVPRQGFSRPGRPPASAANNAAKAAEG